jgi:hypothetical protein
MNREAMSILAGWVEKYDDFDPYHGLVTPIGPCEAGVSWWDDRCWYTEDEKDQMASNAYWAKRLPKRGPVTQQKVEWGQSYSEPT